MSALATSQYPLDAHREMLHDSTQLDQILSLHHTRILSKNLTCQFKRRQYQLQGYGHGYRLRGAHVTPLCVKPLMAV